MTRLFEINYIFNLLICNLLLYIYMNENFLYGGIIIYRIQNDFLNEDAITSLIYIFICII